MNKPWQAETRVDATLAEQLIIEQFPELAPLSLRELGEGWDNVAFLINNQWVFRFPRRQIAVALIQKECELLPTLAQRVPLAIPSPCFQGAISDRYAWPFAGYAYLPGKTGCETPLSREARCNNALILADFLKKLHAVSIEEMQALGITTDSIGRLDLKKRLPWGIDNLKQLAAQGVFTDPVLRNFLQQCSPDYQSDMVCVTHGDLDADHVLVDNERLCGVIDWGDCELGHPAIDLSLAWSFLPYEAHAAFKQAYGTIDEQTWHLACIRAIFSVSMRAIYSRDVKRQDMFTESLVALQFLSESIGRM